MPGTQNNLVSIENNLLKLALIDQLTKKGKEDAKMNKEMLKKVMNDMDVVKELDEYGKNKLATPMEGLLIEIMGKERYEYLLENPKDKGNGSYKRSLNTGLGKLELGVPRTRSRNFCSHLFPPTFINSDLRILSKTSQILTDLGEEVFKNLLRFLGAL